MGSAAYGEARLAALYDALNRGRDDHAFYLSLAGPPPRRLLDLGCGTGELALALAARGHAVTGVDPAAAMLERARRKPGAGGVRWIRGDLAAVPQGEGFDLAIMTGHVFQVFLADEAVAGLLRRLRGLLRPEGRLAFETRNPLAREWEGWTAEGTRQGLALPGGEAVEVCYQVTAVEEELVTYETRFAFPGEPPVVATDRLRFMPRERLAVLLAEAGFGAVEWYGDWDRAPWRPESPEIICVAGGGGSGP